MPNLARNNPGDVVPRPERRGLNRVEAAAYIGVSPSTFDKLVLEGKMPGPKQIYGWLVYDRVALDLAFEAIKSKDEPEGATGWEDWQ